MTHRLRFVVASMLLTLGAAVGTRAEAPPAGEYIFDTDHTSIVFVVEHMGLADIYGRFSEFEGRVTLGDQPQLQTTIQTASVDTAVKRRDDHLRSPDLFDVRQFPTITFSSTGIEVEDGIYHVTGDFTMHGQSHEITIPLTYRGSAEFQGQQRVGFSGEFTIDRREWGLTAWEGLVSFDVRLLLSFEAIRQ